MSTYNLLPALAFAALIIAVFLLAARYDRKTRAAERALSSPGRDRRVQRTLSELGSEAEGLWRDAA